MLATPKRLGRLLPRNWPSQVRSAVRRSPCPTSCSPSRAATATVPTSLGYGISWLPFALPQRWPFCWWLAVAVDHYSRRVLGAVVFRSEPVAVELTRFLGRIYSRRPAHLSTDHGPQFTADRFREWCQRSGIGQRFGAVGKYGSLAVVERWIRSLKNECTRAILVPFSRSAFEREIRH